MNRMQTLVGGLMLVVGTTAITSAVIPQADNDDPWDMYCVPGPEHDVLEHLAGRWQLDISATLNEGDDPIEATMTCDYRWLFGGRFLIGEFSGYVAGELFEARELLGFDRYRGEFASVWADNMTTAFDLSRGTYDKRTQTLTMEGRHDDLERGLKDRKFKNVWRFEGDDNYVQQIYRQDGDGKMHRRAEVRATRLE